MTRKKKCYYCGDPTTNRPDPINSLASPESMQKCSEWKVRPNIRRMVAVCSACRSQLRSVEKIVERLKPGGDETCV